MSDPDRPREPAESVWELRFGVYCTEAQARELVDRFLLLLCPDPEHAGPCRIPWDAAHWPLDDGEAAESHPTLVEQVRIERGPVIGFSRSPEIGGRDT